MIFPFMTSPSADYVQIITIVLTKMWETQPLTEGLIYADVWIRTQFIDHH